MREGRKKEASKGKQVYTCIYMYACKSKCVYHMQVYFAIVEGSSVVAVHLHAGHIAQVRLLKHFPYTRKKANDV